MFEQLYNKSQINEYLTFSEFEMLVKLNNPNFILQRTHISRILNELDNAISELSLPIKIQYNKRNKTVGPWYLIIEKNIKIIYKNKEDSPNHSLNKFFIPTKKQNISNIFHSFINQWFKSYSCYYLGLLNEALDELNLCYQYPISLFIENILDIYKAKLFILKGDLDNAEDITKRIIEDTRIARENQVKEQAYILQAKIQYMHKPIANYEQLLSLDFRPQKYYQENHIALMEWHNIQSLLLKRKLLRYKNFIKVKELHYLVINHLQEAIISTIIIENNSKLLDFCCNYTLYLQSVLPLKLSTIPQVLEWYQLSYCISNKLGIGDYSIWQDIFYAEFYLTNYDFFTKEDRKIEPSQEKFYLDVINKMEYYSNQHLNAIFYLCYFKFLKKTNRNKKLNKIADKFISLLNSNNTLYTKLIADGYQGDIQSLIQYTNQELQSS